MSVALLSNPIIAITFIIVMVLFALCLPVKQQSRPAWHIVILILSILVVGLAGTFLHVWLT